MFHGKPPHPGNAHPPAEVQDERGILRELTWADLVARLKASRGGRDVFGEADEAMDASFDATCARRIAAHHNGKSSVNLEDSSYGKEARRRRPQGMKGAGSGFAPGSRGSK